MKFFVLYWYLTQATLSSFTGLSTLPIVQHEFVEKRHWITDQQLNNAILIGRSTPGPMAVYVVSVGQMCGGIPGAAAGWLALMTPALGILILLRGLANRTEDPRFKNAIRYIVLASNGYALATLYSLSRAALTNATLAAFGIASAALMLRTKIDTLWILIAAGLLWVLLA